MSQRQQAFRPAGDEAVLDLVGELDIARASELRTMGEAALSDGLAAVHLDLGGVTFIDSAGIGAIVHLNNLAARRGTRFDLRNTPPAVRRVLGLAGLADLL